MKIRTITTFAITLFMAISLTSCSVKEKDVSVSGVQLTGSLKEFAKVVDATYKFTNDDKNAFITVQFELTKKPNQELCRKKHPETIRLNAIDGNGSIFDTGNFGFEANRTEMGKLKDFLNKGNIGDKVSVSFEWSFYSVSEEIGKSLFKNATSFEIIDNTFNNCSKLSEDDLHWEDVKSASSSKSIKSSTSIDNEDWDAFLKSYEDYLDQYIKLMKKVNAGDNSAMNEYSEYMEKLTDLSKKMEKSKGSLSTSQIAKYTKLQTKFINSMSEMK